MLSRREIRLRRARFSRRIAGSVLLRYLIAVLALCAGSALVPEGRVSAEPADAPGSPGSVEATKVTLSGDGSRIVFALDLSTGVTVEIVTLANPYRVIVDLPHVTFRLPDGAGAGGQGLVKAFRYGLFAEQKSRVVIDTTGPVRIETAEMETIGPGSGVRLSIGLVPMDVTAFGAGTGAARRSPVAPPGRPPEAVERKNRAKPVVLIDPGHGGIDPGAIGASNLLEKNIVLAVGRQLGAALAKSGRYEVQFTRSTDIFVSLNERIALSRRFEADLFISLHADAIEAKDMAQTIRGASIYTLSERASDEKARLQAERENASDLLAGIDAAEGDERDEVMSILLDLMKRETAEFSTDFANMLVAKLGRSISLSSDPQRSAAFKVLKQTHAPSVLVELGYMSHAEEEKLMTQSDWQKRVSQSIMTAIDAYFVKRTARAK